LSITFVIFYESATHAKKIKKKTTHVGKPHELELREDGLDEPDEEVHGVDVDEGVLPDVTVLHLDGHHLARRLQLCLVDLEPIS
jgi:hypothetical protein